ncbi:MAG: hypothetical protein ACMXX7_01520 [Candidatus Woesearchaeota archaeon]
MTKQKHMPKPNKKLILKAAIAIIAIILIIIIITTISKNLTKDNPKANLNLNLADSRIQSGEETFLSISIQNTGKVELIGTFNITVDDKQSVNITIDQDRLNFNLLEGEQIQRRIPISATSKAHRTDYEITVTALTQNQTITTNSIILSVRR